MAEPTTNSETASGTTPAAGTPPAATPASPNPSLLGAEPVVEAPAPGAAQTPEQIAAAAESTARADAFAKAEGVDAKKAAYEALTKDEKVAAFKAMGDEVKKELGVEDPAIPSYTDFKLPEGMAIDAEGMKPAIDLFKESGLSQEQAQKFIDLATSREVAAAQKGQQAYVDMQNKWVSEIKADPEIGGEKLTANVAKVGQLIDRLAIPGLREALDLTGAGNNPAITKAFVRLAQMTAEDRFAGGNGAAAAPPVSPAQAIYGDDSSKPSN